MFADPIVISDEGTNRSLARTGTTATEGEYRLEVGGVFHTLTIAHDFGQGRGNRRKSGGAAPDSTRRGIMRYVREYLVTDPLVTGQSKRVAVTATLTMAWPAIVTAAEAAARGVTIASLATATNLGKVAAGEI